ncbi:MAG: nitroreductase [Dehalococcoidales bacterium]|nr:nitroreductase [Dehalococcoidales bacterium]
MEIIEAIRSRRSVRSYQQKPVPRQIIEEIISVARRSPSSVNTQPWEITVVSGDVLESIKKEHLAKLAEGIPPAPEVPETRFQDKYRQRQVDLAVQIFQLMGISREDKVKRMEWLKRGFSFFDAPVAIFIGMDRSLAGEYSRFDLGAIAQTICLAALSYGLSTCIHGQGVSYPDVVRKYAGIPETKRLDVCISIGYADADFPANRLESQREPLENFVTWRGF